MLFVPKIFVTIVNAYPPCDASAATSPGKCNKSTVKKKKYIENWLGHAS
jgi:hypothetical protein